MIPIIGVIVGIATVAAAPAEFYQSRYDHLDIESILNNRRMVNYYAACMLSQGPCPPQGLDFKRILPEALTTNCAKCTEKQRTIAYRTIKRLRKEYPKIWNQLVLEWDPDDVFVRKFEGFFEGDKPLSSSSQSPVIINRFGDNEDSDSAATAASAYPPPTNSTTSTTTTTLTPTTKSTNKPSSVTHSPIYVTRPPQAPPFASVGTNLQATVTFMAALKNIVIQLYQHKLDVINRILSGRYN